MGDLPFDHVITDKATLRARYRQPSTIAAAKDRPTLDEATVAFLAQARFVTVATHDAAGATDVSPKGGPAGFVQVLDEHRLIVADLAGNNRLDGFTNLLSDDHVGLLFVVPGRHETVRVNGRACITTDPALLDRFPPDLRRPTAALGVLVETTFIHCGKAFHRGAVWDPDQWPVDGPDAADILVAQGVVPSTAAETRAALADSYATAAAADRA